MARSQYCVKLRGVFDNFPLNKTCIILQLHRTTVSTLNENKRDTIKPNFYNSDTIHNPWMAFQ